MSAAGSERWDRGKVPDGLVLKNTFFDVPDADDPVVGPSTCPPNTATWGSLSLGGGRFAVDLDREANDEPSDGAQSEGDHGSRRVSRDAAAEANLEEIGATPDWWTPAAGAGAAPGSGGGGGSFGSGGGFGGGGHFSRLMDEAAISDPEDEGVGGTPSPFAPVPPPRHPPPAAPVPPPSLLGPFPGIPPGELLPGGIPPPPFLGAPMPGPCMAPTMEAGSRQPPGFLDFYNGLSPDPLCLAPGFGLPPPCAATGGRVLVLSDALMFDPQRQQQLLLHQQQFNGLNTSPGGSRQPVVGVAPSTVAAAGQPKAARRRRGSKESKEPDRSDDPAGWLPTLAVVDLGCLVKVQRQPPPTEGEG